MLKGTHFVSAAGRVLYLPQGVFSSPPKDLLKASVFKNPRFRSCFITPPYSTSLALNQPHLMFRIFLRKQIQA